jgi:hypothetical protein
MLLKLHLVTFLILQALLSFTSLASAEDDNSYSLKSPIIAGVQMTVFGIPKILSASKVKITCAFHRNEKDSIDWIFNEREVLTIRSFSRGQKNGSNAYELSLDQSFRDNKSTESTCIVEISIPDSVDELKFSFGRSGLITDTKDKPAK